MPITKGTIKLQIFFLPGVFTKNLSIESEKLRQLSLK